jgi:flagellar biosynthetic protein FlhB
VADPDKTEKATPKRRAKARRDGVVAKSAEINQTAVLVATLAALAIEAPRLFRQMEAIMHDGLARTANPDAVVHGGLGALSMWAIKVTATAAAPVLLVGAFAALAANVFQVGFKFSGKAIRPSLQKINIGSGLKQLFSPRKGVELAKALAKLLIIGGVAGLTLWSKLPRMGLLVGMPPGELISETAHLLLSIAIRVSAALVVLSAIDYAVQKRTYEKRLRMTKEEIKQEGKEGNLPPEVRAKIRQKQIDQARRRMIAEVPDADVVVVNPTHFAVALKYDGSKAAPEVVAKGVDNVALKIREVADEAGVPIVHQPPLARALYAGVEIGAQIPEEFFGAVAEVLAFVFRTARRKRRRVAAAV